MDVDRSSCGYFLQLKNIVRVAFDWAFDTDLKYSIRRHWTRIKQVLTPVIYCIKSSRSAGWTVPVYCWRFGGIHMGKSSESVQCAMLKACDACTDMGQL